MSFVQGDTRQFNLAWGHKDPDAPVIEFLVAAAQGACQLYSGYFTQVADQVGTVVTQAVIGKPHAAGVAAAVSLPRAAEGKAGCRWGCTAKSVDCC